MHLHGRSAQIYCCYLEENSILANRFPKAARPHRPLRCGGKLQTCGHTGANTKHSRGTLKHTFCEFEMSGNGRDQNVKAKPPLKLRCSWAKSSTEPSPSTNGR